MLYESSFALFTLASPAFLSFSLFRLLVFCSSRHSRHRVTSRTSSIMLFPNSPNGTQARFLFLFFFSLTNSRLCLCLVHLLQQMKLRSLLDARLFMTNWIEF